MPRAETRPDDLDEEVNEAFCFFRVTLEAEVRQQGEAMLRELLGQSGRSGRAVAPGRGRGQQGEGNTG